ncbi:MAG: amidinotransferase [Chitinophagaceae bacterium]|nr:MAG: amidinotransferase [Chitinophagaceae bacterium]
MITDTVLMVRPAAFCYNEQTAVNNHFQNVSRISTESLQKQALLEFDTMVASLQAAGIQVMVVEDTPEPVKPDAIFPNNWLSTTADGRVHLYPLFAPNRRLERRPGIVKLLQQMFDVQRVNDWTFLEEQELFLEGTGSLVFDHRSRTAYAALSPRTNLAALSLIANSMGYEAVAFEAADQQGRDIYHTNVLLSIGDDFAAGCSSAFKNEEQLKLVQQKLAASDHEWIDLSFAEMQAFGANLLQLKSVAGKSVIALSKTAFDTIQPATRQRLAKFGILLPLDVSTIEQVNGGSVRCMLCEIFLPPKAVPASASRPQQ